MQNTFESIQLNSRLTEDGFALIDHHIPPDMIDEAVATYADFTDQLPDPSLETLSAMIVDPDKLDNLDYSKDKEKNWHKYRTNHPQYAKPGGYTNRSEQIKALQLFHRKVTDEVTGELVAPSDDPKEYFHFHPNAASIPIMEQMHEDHGWGPIPPEVYKVHEKFTKIHFLSRQAITKTFQLLEDEHPELTSRFATKADLFGSPVRLLYYHPGQGDLLAGGHTDKGLATIQLAESHVGFRARKPSSTQDKTIEQYRTDPVNDPSMMLLRRPPEKGVFFIAEAIRNELAYPGSPLTPLWHDVINVDEVNEQRIIHGEDCVRWAMIFFANSPAAGMVGKDRTHREVTRTI